MRVPVKLALLTLAYFPFSVASVYWLLCLAVKPLLSTAASSPEDLSAMYEYFMWFSLGTGLLHAWFSSVVTPALIKAISDLGAMVGWWTAAEATNKTV